MRKITRGEKVETLREGIKGRDGPGRTESRERTIVKITTSDVTEL